MIIDHFHDDTKGIHWYHIRYVVSDDLYKEFYSWKNTKPLHYDHSDMPHDYFVFLNEADRLEMHEKFKEHIEPEKYATAWVEEWTDCTISPDPNSIEYQFMEILREEINKEVMQVIISKINETRT